MLIMASAIGKKTKQIAYLLALVYFSSYFMRINFAVMMVKICSDMQVEKSALAIVVTGLTVAYGTGQVISGVLGDRIKPQYLITAGLSLATLCNVCISLCSGIPAMTAVWCVNGFAHALLWPPIVRLLSTHLSDAEYSYASVRVSWGSSVATIVLYLLCPLLLGVLHWRAVILTCAAWGAIATVLWLILYPRLFRDALEERTPTQNAAAESPRMPLPRYALFAVVLIMLGIVMQGMLRDGVTNWMPSYLLETFGLSEESSIVSTVVLALFSILSFSVSDLIHRKLFANEVTCATAIFGVSAVSSLILYVVNVLCPDAALIPSLILMSLTVACMHGINLMLIAIVPKAFVKCGKVSTYSGILNACTYVGASISTYGFAAIAEQFDWNFTILTWIGISAIGLLLCALAAPIWKKFKAE